MDNQDQFQQEFVKNACFRLDEGLRMIRISLVNITEEQLWQKPNASLNSIGNLMLHLCGNLSQYGITSLNGSEDKRQRDAEFNTTGGFTKAQLFQQLESTVNTVKSTMGNLGLERFLAVKKVQGFEFSGIGSCVHLVEHFSYHTGQIAFWVKLLNDEQLGFYDGMDLNTLNEN